LSRWSEGEGDGDGDGGGESILPTCLHGKLFVVNVAVVVVICVCGHKVCPIPGHTTKTFNFYIVLVFYILCMFIFVFCLNIYCHAFVVKLANVG